MSKVSGRLCIKFEVDTKKLEKRNVSYTNFLYPKYNIEFLLSENL